MRLLRCARNDATTLTICDVAYSASTLPAIVYILSAARLGFAIFEKTLYQKTCAYVCSIKQMVREISLHSKTEAAVTYTENISVSKEMFINQYSKK